MPKNMTKTLIISCWSVLFIYFIIKLLGGNYFEIECTNPHFIDFCNWLDTDGNWLTYIIYPLLYTAQGTLITLAIVKQRIKSKSALIIVVSSLVVGIIKQFINFFALDFIILVILPIIIIIFVLKQKFNGRCILRIILANVSVIMFQLISQITKNIGLKELGDNSLIALISSIDYYLMICLYYLYSNRKEMTKNNG